MITLTLSTPANDALIAAGYTAIQVLKSVNQTEAGGYTPIGTPISLVAGTTTYTFVDPVGTYGDWYTTYHTGPSIANSPPSAPQPGYLSDLLGTIRDLLGVSTTHISDSQIQGFAYLPTALARIRDRLPTFDTLIAGGSDPAALCLGALAHYTASLLCPRMTVAVVDSEQFGQYRYQLNRQMDWTATAQALMAEYELLISLAAKEVVTLAAVYVSPVKLAGPTRSGVEDTSGGLVQFATPDNGSFDENPLVPYTGPVSQN